MGRALLRARNRSANVADVQRVALELIERSGFDGVTVADVAREAGVSASTVYRYFGTKEALVLTGDGVDGLLDAVDAAAQDAAALDGARHDGASPAGVFRTAMAALLAGADQAALLARLRLAFGDAALAAAFEHHLLSRRDALAERFAVHRGAPEPAVRDLAAAGALLGILVAVFDRWQRSNGEKSLIKMLDKALTVVK